MSPHRSKSASHSGGIALPVLCWFAFPCAVTVGATVLALEKRPISASLRHPANARFAIRPTASGDMLDIYIYAFGSQSCATRLVFEGSAPLIDIAFGDSASLRGIPASAQNKAAHGTSGRVRRGARGLGLTPAPCAAAPVVFAAIRAAMLCRRNTASSPCDVSHRASDEPRRRMSLSSPLGPSSLASPSAMARFFS